MMIRDLNIVIRCPTYLCKVALPTETTVQSLATKADFDELSERLTMQAVSRLPQIVYCSNPTCHTPFEIDDAGGILTCPGCATKTCGSCGSAWHDGLACGELKRAEFQKLLDAFRYAQGAAACSKKETTQTTLFAVLVIRVAGFAFGVVRTTDRKGVVPLATSLHALITSR